MNINIPAYRRKSQLNHLLGYNERFSLDRQRYHSLQLLAGRLSFHLLDVSDPIHCSFLPEHMLNALVQHVQSNKS